MGTRALETLLIGRKEKSPAEKNLSIPGNSQSKIPRGKQSIRCGSGDEVHSLERGRYDSKRRISIQSFRGRLLFLLVNSPLLSSSSGDRDRVRSSLVCCRRRGQYQNGNIPQLGLFEQQKRLDLKRKSSRTNKQSYPTQMLWAQFIERFMLRTSAPLQHSLKEDFPDLEARWDSKEGAVSLSSQNLNSQVASVPAEIRP